jgi:hypothetical protein
MTDEFERIRKKGPWLNPSKPSGYYVYNLLQCNKTLHAPHIVYLCVPTVFTMNSECFPKYCGVAPKSRIN